MAFFNKEIDIQVFSKLKNYLITLITGVFVKKGKIHKGQVACLYPGLVYQPYHPILLASIKNAYIFRCSDGTMLDGKKNGLSG